MDTQQSKIHPVAPQNPEQPQGDHHINRSGRLWGGLVIVAVGGVLLARQMGVGLPYWLFQWEMLLIGIGIYIGARHNFRNPGWIVPVLMGSFFLLDDYFYDLHLQRYFWPLFIIGIGLFMILRSRRSADQIRKRFTDEFGTVTGSEDVLEIVTIFGGVKKNIIAKDFKGGEAVTVFGGTELNLLQADTKDRIVLELVQVFGGTKLIVPPHWKIHAEEMVTIFGGLNDKRPITTQNVSDETKVIILKGTCIFGGIDIKSF